jgi:hypothetical protein
MTPAENFTSLECKPFPATFQIGIALTFLTLGGCAYMETVMEREGEPDTRVQLPSLNGNFFLSYREIADYTCAQDLLLQCDRTGSTYSCWCGPR